MSTENKFLKYFEDISMGVSKYITLDALQIGFLYEIIQFRLHESTYGRCLIVDLADGSTGFGWSFQDESRMLSSQKSSLKVLMLKSTG